MPRLTIADVARLAGVSTMTVSRVLNQAERVRPALRERVQDVVRATGFVPNAMAGSLRSSKARLVAAALPALTGPVFQETVRALDQALFERGYQLILGQYAYETEREEELLTAILRRRPDGVVLVGVDRSTQSRRQLLASGIPVVETWDLTPSPIDMLVGFSNERIGETVCAYLHQKGYRRPALLCGDDARARRRADGFTRTGRILGFQAVIQAHFAPPPTTVMTGRSGLGMLLEQDPDIDSVFCSSDMLALGVMIEAQVRGIAVPRELAVVGLGDLDLAASLEPALTTVRIDGTLIGQSAARMIVDRTEGRETGSPVIDIGFSLIERAST